VSLFVSLGILILLGGLVLLVTGIRRHGERQPKHTAMLIGGMMMTAFGLVIAGFAIAYENAAPLDLNTSSAPTP
jgi:drug/metabolite transporter (DMT)-like permease